MSATVVSLRPAETDPLAELLADRAKVEAELGRLGIVDQRLADAEGRLAEIAAGLQAIDRADVEQMRLWADSGDGEAPRPLTEERRALLGRRLDAQAELDGARHAVAAVAAKRSALVADIGRIDRQLWIARLDAIMQEAMQLHVEATEIAKRLTEPATKLGALRLALGDYIASSPVGELQMRAGKALERLDGFPKINAAGDAATAHNHARVWRERLR